MVGVGYPNGVGGVLCLKLSLVVSALGRSVCRREGQHLQGVEGILPHSNVLLCIANPSSLAVGCSSGWSQ